jgi:hypothetical protein
LLFLFGNTGRIPRFSPRENQVARNYVMHLLAAQS